MKNAPSPMQIRLRALGIRQNELARALGLTVDTVSDSVRARVDGPVARMLPAILNALETMTPAQRAAWMAKES